MFIFIGSMPDYFDPDGDSYVSWPILESRLASEVGLVVQDRCSRVRFRHFVRSW